LPLTITAPIPEDTSLLKPHPMLLELAKTLQSRTRRSSATVFKCRSLMLL
jgi:hypothetical protein